MRSLSPVLSAFGAVFLSLNLSQAVQAQTPTIDGQITAGEYGSSYGTGAQTWYMSWDDNNLYVATTAAGVGQGTVMYFDTDPDRSMIVNSANNAGTTEGFGRFGEGYDKTSGTLPFSADAVIYVRPAARSNPSDPSGGYRESRKYSAEITNWGPQNSGIGSVEDNNDNVREFSIPWSEISTTNARPANFNWFGYITTENGFVYGQVPFFNRSGSLGNNANFLRYFTVLNTAAGSSSRAFGPNNLDSYSHSGPDEETFGAITVYDFTLNTFGAFITRAGAGSAWDIQGNLRVGNGNLNLGASTASVRVAGDLTFNDPTAFNAGNAPVILTGSGNQTISGDTYNSLIIQSTGIKTITSNLTITESLVISNGTLATGTNTVALGTTGRLNESSTGYLLGRVSALTPTPLASEGASHDFGNIGLVLTQRQPQSSGSFLNNVSVLRVTGFPGTLEGGPELRRTLSRRFSINANLNNNPGSQSYNVSMDFRYRTGQFDELGGNNPALLELYQSESASNFTGTYREVENVTYARTTPSVVRTIGALRLDGSFFSLADGITPLPVELVSFTGQAESSTAHLIWATASELNNKGFDIEHRTDLSEWKKVGFVAGNGTTTKRSNYGYIHRSTATGNNYYRLRQIDRDGKSVYSQPVTVQLGAVAFTLSPVPATDVLTFNGLGAGKYTAEIYNSRGQRVLSQEFKDEAAATVAVRSLPAGVYIVRVLGTDRSTRNARFIKQ